MTPMSLIAAVAQSLGLLTAITGMATIGIGLIKPWAVHSLQQVRTVDQEDVVSRRRRL